jgi:hypothetical protein
MRTASLVAVKAPEPNLLNTGLYTVPEASRLTRISTGKIRRWIKGYDFRTSGSIRHSDAVWQGEIKPIDKKISLSFRDLLELRFVDAFIRVGVSWRAMRHATRERRMNSRQRIRFAPIASSPMAEAFFCAKARRTWTRR